MHVIKGIITMVVGEFVAKRIVAGNNIHGVLLHCKTASLTQSIWNKADDGVYPFLPLLSALIIGLFLPCTVSISTDFKTVITYLDDYADVNFMRKVKTERLHFHLLF
jgi:urea transporter